MKGKNKEVRFGPEACTAQLLSVILSGISVLDSAKDIVEDAIVIAEAFEKKTRATPKRVIEVCQQRLKSYDGEG